jgi:malonyl-CoA O-methyltransferase
MSLTVENELIDISPAAYAEASALAEEIGKEMLSRLDWVILQPEVIVDIGSGAGKMTSALRCRYPEAHLIALDVAYPMLQYAKLQEKNGVETKTDYVCANALALPLIAHSVDLIFANLVLPWCGDLENYLREWRRVLRPDGLLVFTSLGPDTLQTWRASLANSIIPNCIDMHVLGDALTAARFSDPVMDVDYFTLTYRQLENLFQELQASGMVIPGNYTALKEAQQNATGLWETTYEVVFGHAWGPQLEVDQVVDAEGIVKIPLSHLRYGYRKKEQVD